MDDGTVGPPGSEESLQARPRRWRSPWVVGPISFVILWLGIEVLTLPFGEVTSLRKSNPRETAFMKEQADQMADAGKKFHKVQEWVPLGRMPRDLVNAVVVAEDGTFWSHSGFDWFEFKESVERNLKEGRAARGASTITQQLVKNLYLSSSKNPVRKLREWVLTWWMEQRLSKSRILELYLNVIEWGPGVYGAEAASETYFQKDVSDLTREEAVRLAAIIPSPRVHRADEQSPYMERRTAVILDRMNARGY